MRLLSFILLVSANFAFAVSPNEDRIVVAKDSFGNFKTVQSAIDSVPKNSTKPVTIFIRKGRYEELVRIPIEKPNIHLVGEDRKEVVIAYTNNDKLHAGAVET
jgi:pectinesterase